MGHNVALIRVNNENVDRDLDWNKDVENTLTMESYLRLCGRQYNYVVVTYMTP